jgi:hypothetical protein
MFHLLGAAGEDGELHPRLKTSISIMEMKLKVQRKQKQKKVKKEKMAKTRNCIASVRS